MVTNSIKISNFLDTKYKTYAYYVLNSRAIPSIKDGLKPVQRRILWISKNEAKDYIKVSNLAGKTLCIHPHGDTPISQAISNMTQDFCGANNIPLFEGKGAFGCKILGPGKGIGASRYVSIKLSKFAKEVVFRDLDLINTIPNYDGEYIEAENFLPLIPLILLNGISGIAVGFATEILSYNLKDLIDAQIEFLKTGKINKKIIPYYKGFKGEIKWDSVENRFYSLGKFKKSDNELHISELPIGIYREQFISLLDKLIEREIIKDYEDNSKGEYDIIIFLRKSLKDFSDEKIISTFKLKSYLNQNLTALNSKNVLTIYNDILEIIKEFTEWRFSFVEKKYKKLYDNLFKETDDKKEFLKFIEYVIKHDYLKIMSKTPKSKIIEKLKSQFSGIESFIEKPLSSFSEDNIEKLQKQIKENLTQLIKHDIIIKSKEEQKKIYINELKEIMEI